jgi:hypothetical protein
MGENSPLLVTLLAPEDPMNRRNKIRRLLGE